MKKEVVKKLMEQFNCSRSTVYNKIKTGELKLVDEDNLNSETSITIKKENGKRYNRIKNLVFPNCKSFLSLLESKADEFCIEATDTTPRRIEIEDNIGNLTERCLIVDPLFNLSWAEMILYATLCSFYRLHAANQTLHQKAIAVVSISEIYEAIYHGSRWITADQAKFIDFVSKFSDKMKRTNAAVDLFYPDKIICDYKELLSIENVDNALFYIQPTFLTVAEGLKRIVMIPVDILKFGRNTESTVLLKSYLAHRIELTRNEKSKLRKTICYKTVKRDLGFLPDMHWIQSYFDYLKTKGYIKSYQNHEDKITWELNQPEKDKQTSEKCNGTTKETI